MHGLSFTLLLAGLVGWLSGAVACWLDARIDPLLDHGFRAALACRAGRSRRRLPWVEALGAATLMAATALARGMASSAALPILGGSLFICVWLDWRHRILPDLVVLPLLGLGLAAPFADSAPAAQAWIGATMGGVLPWLAGILGRRRGGGIGLGDVKLLAALGAWLGPLAVAVIFLLSSVAILAILLGRRLCGKDEPMPFAPAIAVAAMAWLSAAPTNGLFHLGLFSA